MTRLVRPTVWLGSERRRSHARDALRPDESATRARAPFGDDGVIATQAHARALGPRRNGRPTSETGYGSHLVRPKLENEMRNDDMLQVHSFGFNG